jgi:hypothetical protein
MHVWNSAWASVYAFSAGDAGFGFYLNCACSFAY